MEGRREGDGVRNKVKAYTSVQKELNQALIVDTERTELLTLITD